MIRLEFWLGSKIDMSWLNNSNTGRALASVFLRGGNTEAIEEGATYHRIHSDNMVETAEVLSISDDAVGIPHVRYQVSFRRTNRNDLDGDARMLSLSSFADRYTELVVN